MKVMKYGKKYVLLYANGTKAKEYDKKADAERELKRLANLKF